MDRILIRKLIWNIFSESQYINTMMELADRKNPDSAIALSQEELREILIMLSQVDYLKDYLKEHNIPYIDSKKCTKLNCPFQLDVIPDDCDEKECLWRTEEKTGEKTAKVVNYVCDRCGFWLTDGIMDYCPGCGAKLEWKNEEN